ncbi:MAG: hypothetical protein ACYS9X_26430, partial [Planctomycetota bacterium]
PARVAGRLIIVHRKAGPAVGIDLEGGSPRLFANGMKRSAPARVSAPLGKGTHVLVARRRGGPEGVESFSLETDGRLADALYVASPQPKEGETKADPSYGVEGLTGARVMRIVPRRAEEAFFDDEFTWDEDETGAWRPSSGCWDLATTRDAWIAVDRGPFATSSYRARPAEGGPALSLADTPPVGRVHVEVAAFLPEGGEAGIAFSAAERGDGSVFRALLVKPGPDGAGSARFVVRSGNGLREVSPPVRAYARAGAWTRIEVWSDWDWVRAAVGGRVVLEAETADLPAGRVGLIGLVVPKGKAVLFDDFRVRPWHVVRESAPGERLAWSRTEMPGAGTLLSPALPWRARDFRLEVRGVEGRAAPLPVPVSGGAARDVWGPDVGGSARADASSLAVDVSGAHVLRLVDGKIAEGGAVLEGPEAFTPGVLIPRGATCGAVLVEPSMRPLEVDLFASDFSVPYVRLPFGRGYVRLVGDRLWPTSGRWRCVRRTSRLAPGVQAGSLECDARGLGAIWLSRPCPGDALLEVDISLPAKTGFIQAGVVLAGDPRAARQAPRYTFAVEHTSTEGADAPDGDKGLPPARLVLRRTAEEVGSCPLPVGAGAGAVAEGVGAGRVRLSLERRGAHLLARLDGRLVMSWRDEEPLEGDGAGFFMVGGRASFGRATIRHLRATRSDFRTVEPRWQPLSGKWLPHTGLSCIPWDHWITAFATEGVPAYLGLLREPVRDVCVATRISEAGEGFENRTHVHYPMHDISVTLRGRLDAPRSAGYRFVFAPLPGKRGVVLLRDGLEVASTNDFGTIMGEHHNEPRQFTVVARAEGGRVSCQIDGRRVLEWTDPVPLPAGEVLLGSEKGRVNFADVAVMDARVMEVPRAAAPGKD